MPSGGPHKNVRGPFIRHGEPYGTKFTKIGDFAQAVVDHLIGGGNIKLAQRDSGDFDVHAEFTPDDDNDDVKAQYEYPMQRPVTGDVLERIIQTDSLRSQLEQHQFLPAGLKLTRRFDTQNDDLKRTAKTFIVDAILDYAGPKDTGPSFGKRRRAPGES